MAKKTNTKAVKNSAIIIEEKDVEIMEVVSAPDQTTTDLASYTQEEITLISSYKGEILAIKEQVAKSVVTGFIAIGERLIELKQIVGKHGEWGKWLEANVGFSERKAQQYMQMYKKYGQSELINTQSIAELGYTQALQLVSMEPEEIRAFVEENPGLKDMSVSEINELRKKSQGDGEQLEALQKQLEELSNHQKDLQEKNKQIDEQLKKAVDEKAEIEKQLEASTADKKKELEDIQAQKDEEIKRLHDSLESIKAEKEKENQKASETEAKIKAKLEKEFKSQITKLEKELEESKKREKSAATNAEKAVEEKVREQLKKDIEIAEKLKQEADEKGAQIKAMAENVIAKAKASTLQATMEQVDRLSETIFTELINLESVNLEEADAMRSEIAGQFSDIAARLQIKSKVIPMTATGNY